MQFYINHLLTHSFRWFFFYIWTYVISTFWGRGICQALVLYQDGRFQSAENTDIRVPLMCNSIDAIDKQVDHISTNYNKIQLDNWMFARGILVFYEANTYRDQSVMEIKILIV